MRSNSRIRRDYIILALIVAFHFIVNLIWLSRDGFNIVCIAEEMKLNYLFEIHAWLSDILESGRPLSLKAMDFCNLLHNGPNEFHSVDTPRLIYVVTSVFMYLFGKSVIVAKLSNMIYLGILVFSVYFIGVKIKNRDVGLLSAFLVSMYPGVFGPSRGYGHDFPLMAMVSMAVCLIIYSDRFSRPGFSVLLGTATGLGVLIKPQIVFFLAGPLCVVLSGFFVKSGQKNIENRISGRLINIFLCFLTVLSLSGFWWWGNIRDIFSLFFNDVMFCWDKGKFSMNQLVMTASRNGPQDFFQAGLFYFKAILEYTGAVFFLLFITGLLISFRKDFKEKALLLFWLFVPYCVFTLFVNKYPKYISPVLPAISLLSAIGIFYILSGIKTNIKKYAVMFFIFLAALGQYFYMSFLYGDPHRELEIRRPFPSGLTKDTVDNFKKEISASAEEKIRIGIVRKEGIWGSNDLIFIRYLLKMNIPDAVIRTSFFPWAQGFLGHLDSFDYLIVASYPRYSVKQKMMYIAKDLSDIRQFKLEPSLSTIYMWKRAYKEKGAKGLEVDYGTPELWMNYGGFEDFLKGFTDSSDPPAGAFKRLYGFAESFKGYEFISEGAMQYKGDVFNIYLLKKVKSNL